MQRIVRNCIGGKAKLLGIALGAHIVESSGPSFHAKHHLALT